MAALLSVMEPILLIFVGGLVGSLVISMYLPIFSLDPEVLGVGQTDGKRHAMATTIERRDIFWYIILRVIVVTSILVSAVVLQFAGASVFPIVPVFYLIGLLLSGYGRLSPALLTGGSSPRVQAYVQLVFDLFLITAFVYISGRGHELDLFPLRLRHHRGEPRHFGIGPPIWRPALSAILFGLLVDGMYFGLIRYYSPEHDINLGLGSSCSRWSSPGPSFFVIAFLMNYLSGNLRKTRDALRHGPEGAHHQGAAGRGRPRSPRAWPTRSGTPWRPSPGPSRS